MASSYGYRPPTFGRFNGYPHSPGTGQAGASRYTSGVASALSGHSPLSGSTGYGGYASAPQLTHNPEATGGTQYVAPQAPAQAPTTHQQQPQQPTAPGAYDLNTDPILQQIQALAGRSDEDAQAGALKQQEQLLLGYGDQNLAQSILGQNDPYAQAAGQNPTSVLAGLGHQHDQNIQSYENSLDPSLFYSGARVLGLGEQDRAYQDALAQAAQQANGGLDTIAGNLAAALGQNQQQRISGASDAYSRAIQEALAGGYGLGPYAPGGDTGDITGAAPTDYIGGPGAVAAPNTSAVNHPFGNVNLQTIANALFQHARGGVRAA